jgi:uncharacterized protein involved in response to NO
MKALFAYGFRPFFLFAGAFALLAVPVWLAIFASGALPLHHLPPQLWHAHEMLYGFVLAALAGFLLTAVPSWTGARGFGGAPLVALSCAWLLGRLAFACASQLPVALLALLELAFLPGLAVLLAPPLLRSRNRNTPLLGILALLWLSDAAFLWAVASGEAGLASGALRFAINVMLVVVTLIGGRIVPAFTSNALRRRGQTAQIRTWPLLERAVMLLMAAVLVVDAAWPGSALAGGVAALAAVAQVVRISGWRTLRTRPDPIVWVLHLGMAWLPIGLALKAVSLLTGAAWAAYWIHALTMGVFATMILAVMTRAALGHTGRALEVSGAIAASYGLLTAAVVMRVFGSMLLSNYLWVLVISATLWTSAFAIYVLVYAPILSLPRPDGKPG